MRYARRASVRTTRAPLLVSRKFSTVDRPAARWSRFCSWRDPAETPLASAASCFRSTRGAGGDACSLGLRGHRVWDYQASGTDTRRPELADFRRGLPARLGPASMAARVSSPATGGVARPDPLQRVRADSATTIGCSEGESSSGYIAARMVLCVRQGGVPSDAEAVIRALALTDCTIEPWRASRRRRCGRGNR